MRIVATKAPVMSAWAQSLNSELRSNCGDPLADIRRAPKSISSHPEGARKHFASSSSSPSTLDPHIRVFLNVEPHYFSQSNLTSLSLASCLDLPRLASTCLNFRGLLQQRAGDGPISSRARHLLPRPTGAVRPPPDSRRCAAGAPGASPGARDDPIRCGAWDGEPEGHRGAKVAAHLPGVPRQRLRRRFKREREICM